MSDLHHIYPGDSLPPDGVTAQQKAKRLRELRTWSRQFLLGIAQTGFEPHQGAVFQADGLKSVNAHYWEILSETVKRRITPCNGGAEVRADRHKICSLLELMVAYHQPVRHEDEKLRRNLNARFAYFCALNVIGNWDRNPWTPESEQALKVSDSFVQAHRAWLEHLATQSEQLPIFANAACWYLVEEIFRMKTRKTLDSGGVASGA